MAKVRTHVIHELHEAKGWSQEMLAKKAGIDPKTLSNWMNGGDARLTNIALVAEALDVPPSRIIHGYDPDPSPSTPYPILKKSRVQVELKLLLDFASFEELRELDALLPRLRELTGATKEIAVIAISEGSVLVTLSMYWEDVEKLITSYMEHKLDELPIDSLRILSAHFEMPDNLPRVIDSEVRGRWHNHRRIVEGTTSMRDIDPNAPDISNVRGEDDDGDGVSS